MEKISQLLNSKFVGNYFRASFLITFCRQKLRVDDVTNKKEQTLLLKTSTNLITGVVSDWVDRSVGHWYPGLCQVGT